MKNYELTIVLPGEIPEAKHKKANEKVEKLVSTLGGKVQETQAWGKKDLFYPVKKHTTGVYYFLSIELPADKAPVLNREVELDEEVIRHLLVLSQKSQNNKSEAPSTKSETSKELKTEKVEIVKPKKERKTTKKTK